MSEPSVPPGHVVVAGASGLIGTSAVDHFLRKGWTVTGISRRPPRLSEAGEFRHLPLDLRDADHASHAIAELGGADRLVFAALFESPGLVDGWAERQHRETNLTLLENVVEPLRRAGRLRHVTLFQGTKAYGSHLHDIRVPAKESHPRDPHENFYWLQEDYIRSAARLDGFAFTVLRPQLIVGGAIGVAMNALVAIGVYAAICSRLGEPCGFPGGPAYVWEAVDARLLAECCEWAGSTPHAWGETFNVTNGDVFSWKDLWPALMGALGSRVGPDRPAVLARFLLEHARTWAEIARENRLVEGDLRALLGESHFMADYVLRPTATDAPRAKFVSTIKLRTAGFRSYQDTEASFCFWLGEMIRQNVLPRLG